MRPRNIKAVFFDFDGVVANTDEANRTILKRIIREVLDLELSDDDYKKYYAGKTLSDGVESYLQSINKSEFTDAVIEKKKSSDDEYIRLITPYDDAITLINRLKENGIMVCLATGAREEQLQKALNRFGLENSFAFIVTSKDYLHGKPDPEVYNVLLEKSGMLFAKKDVIAIEDSPVGVEAAKTAGLYCIAVAHTHREDELSQADEIVQSLTDFFKSGKEGDVRILEGE